MPPRVFLFLQGPHGPFFDQLARQLRKAGAATWRIGFNAGDSIFWRDRASYIGFRAPQSQWSETFAEHLTALAVTDIVLYGDTRALHAQAIEIAKARGVHVHVFEEGYLRPYWVTYEKDGSNGNSALIDMSIAQMQKTRNAGHYDPPVPPSHWGDMRQHVFLGAVYHWFVMAWNFNYPNFEPHRHIDVRQEFKLYLKRLLLMPFQAAERMIATRRIRRGSFPYHLALLQLEHDSSFQVHGPYAVQRDFVAEVIAGFARGAATHHHLVFKAHPLEDGRAPLRRAIRDVANQYNIAERVHYVRGGKLAGLISDAISAVTVNSTAGQQALWRGIPLRTLGRSVYCKRELVSDQPLDAFFAAPTRPDAESYHQFRDFLLATSQLPGSFYASKGRRQVIRQVTDMMLKNRDPYQLSTTKSAALRQQLHVVKGSK